MIIAFRSTGYDDYGIAVDGPPYLQTRKMGCTGLWDNIRFRGGEIRISDKEIPGWAKFTFSSYPNYQVIDPINGYAVYLINGSLSLDVLKTLGFQTQPRESAWIQTRDNFHYLALQIKGKRIIKKDEADKLLAEAPPEAIFKEWGEEEKKHGD